MVGPVCRIIEAFFSRNTLRGLLGGIDGLSWGLRITGSSIGRVMNEKMVNARLYDGMIARRHWIDV